MRLFVHLAPETRAALIRRNGIRRLRKASGNRPGGIFAVPVTRSFYVSHPWLRELKRRGQGTISGVYFRLPDDEPVWVGHYAQNHRRMTAAQAAAEFHDAQTPTAWRGWFPGYRVCKTFGKRKLLERGCPETRARSVAPT
jgi:hypothetical protein